jgi:hypothetical protein
MLEPDSREILLLLYQIKLRGITLGRNVLVCRRNKAQIVLNIAVKGPDET